MACGITNNGPCCACAIRSSRGQASAIAITISTEQIKVDANAPKCSDSKAVIAAEPANPPMLNSA